MIRTIIRRTKMSTMTTNDESDNDSDGDDETGDDDDGVL